MFRLVLLIALTQPVRADLRIVSTRTNGGRTVRETDYYKGDFMRADAPHISYIADPSHHVTILFPNKREYWVQSTDRRNAGFTIDTSRTVVIETETRDTGEQKQVWGHTAHHYITIRRSRMEDHTLPDTPWHETTIDSWFLNMPVPTKYRNISATGAVFTLGYNNSRPDVRFSRTGPQPKGILINEKMSDSEFEVTELSEAPLSRSLFEPPTNYRRVIHPEPGQKLAWDEQILYYWQQFEGWFKSFFS